MKFNDLVFFKYKNVYHLNNDINAKTKKKTKLKYVKK